MLKHQHRVPTGQHRSPKICIKDFIDEFKLGITPIAIRHLMKRLDAPKRIPELRCKSAYYERADFIRYMRDCGILE